MSFFRVGFGYLEANESVTVFVGCVICKSSEILGLGSKVFRLGLSISMEGMGMMISGV